MEIKITNTKTIQEIQAEFNTEFPYLKIEFFDAPPVDGVSLPKSKIILNNKKLSTCRKQTNEGDLHVCGTQTVSVLENSFWEKYRLSVQVFRKSGNLWIETSLTDSWTLEQQNKEGFEMSSQHKNPYKEAEDTD
jgi:hypothetical protein